jgi:hypothetical protein
MKQKNETLWDNDEVQFARLLSELEMAGAPTEQQMQDLQESMDLCESEIWELFLRAQILWTKQKQKILFKKE